MSGFIQLLRPKNCFMAVLSVLIVALVATDLDVSSIPLVEILAASMVVFLFTGAGNALNDYLDRDIDRSNHPDRPIPAGKTNPKNAIIFSVVLFGISIIMGLWLSFYCMLLILINLAIMLAYEFKAKAQGLPGNLMISWLTSSLFLFGGLSVLNKFPGIMEPVLFMFLLSFFATLGREIAKDIEDVEGDIGRNTLPMRVGIPNARHVSSMAFLIGIGLSPLPYFFGIFGLFYLITVLFADAIFIYGACVLSRNPGKTSESAKLAMFIALVAFLLGGI